MEESETLISIDEYLHTDYSPDCDDVDGMVEDRNFGDRPHSNLQGALAAFFWTRRRQLEIWPYIELRLRVSSARVRISDICFYIGPEPEEDVPTTPPFVCIEILSPEDRTPCMLGKIVDYLKFDVRYGVHEITDGVLRTADPEIVVPLEEVLKH